MTKSQLFIRAVCSCALAVCSVAAHAVAVSGQGTWETTLQGRNLDSDPTTYEAYYDTVLGVTWLADVNAAAGSGYDLLGSGYMYLSNALDWVADLNIHGITGWRLPDTQSVDGNPFNVVNLSETANGSTNVGYNISAPGSFYAGSTASELAYMYYNTLGNLSPCVAWGALCQPVGGWGLANTGPFSNLMGGPADIYLSGSAFAYNNHTNYMNFSLYDGYANYQNNLFPGTYLGWAVHDGDIGNVPVPAALWLFGSGLVGLIGIFRRKKAV